MFITKCLKNMISLPVFFTTTEIARRIIVPTSRCCYSAAATLALGVNHFLQH